jgi:hypothetical protein
MASAVKARKIALMLGSIRNRSGCRKVQDAASPKR